MTLILSSKWSEKLLTLPESGMGYQRVNVRLKSGKLITGLIVENAEQLNIPKNVASFKEEDILDIEISK